MTSLRYGLSVGVMGLLVAAGCPADDGDDAADDDAAMTTMPTDTGTEEEESTAEESADSTGGGAALSHAADVQPIWDAHCVDACHEEGGQWGFLLDMSGDAYGVLVDKPSPSYMSLTLVVPGEPNESFVWHKIMGTQASVGGGGVQMPSARPMMEPTVLSQEELDTIEQWIAGGANP